MIDPEGKCKKFSYKVFTNGPFYGLADLFEILSNWRDETTLYNDQEACDLESTDRVIQSGDYDLGDYGAGFYNLNLSLCFNKHHKYFSVRIGLSTIDNGNSDAVSGPIEKYEDAKHIYDELKDKLSVNNLLRVPSFDEFAEFLLQYGLILDTDMS